MSGGRYVWSPATEVIFPILEILNPRAWIKVKANMGHITSKHLAGGWHYDMRLEEVAGPGGELDFEIRDGKKIRKSKDSSITGFPDAMNSQLYMNTNNGYTLLEDGTKIDSIENRLTLFPGDMLHTGISQTDTNIRVVLNFNFFHYY